VVYIGFYVYDILLVINCTQGRILHHCTCADLKSLVNLLVCSERLASLVMAGTKTSGDVSGEMGRTSSTASKLTVSIPRRF